MSDATGDNPTFQDPVWVIENVLGVRLYSRQREIVRAVAGYLTPEDIAAGHPEWMRRSAVKAAHSVGKTMLAACLTVGWLVMHEQAIVLTTAPTHRQVEDILWREIRTRWRDSVYSLSPKAPNVTDWSISEDRWAKGFSTDKGEKFQGYHSKHILIIVDEASGVTDEIFEAIEGVMLGGNARLLLIGNPNNDAGEFYEAFEGPGAQLYNQFSIADKDTPLFTGEMPEVPWGEFLITPGAANELRQKYRNHPQVLAVRLDAEFPIISDFQVIPRALVRAAYDVRRPEGQRYAALDIAVGGADDTAYGMMNGGKLEYMEIRGLDKTEQNVAYAKDMLNLHKPVKCIVDANGVGRGVYDYLALAKYPVAAFHAQGQPRDRRRFYNAAAEAWWMLREELENLNLQLDRHHPLANELMKQLAGAVYDIDERGRIRVDKMGANKQSPNLAEMFIMLNRERMKSIPLAAQAQPRGKRAKGSWAGGQGKHKSFVRHDDHKGADDHPGIIAGYTREDGSIFSVR